ncbi:hypothetical protein K501DRAFT_10800 [Backusella circina FSU 941]|nr:hypothetical protein K501DRAFT_10800 [Backusella circina FSU 941]
MASNPETLRALKAEKQAERLEKELESLKNRIKARPTDTKTFQLSEQVKDLKYQLKHQVSENGRLQETLGTKTAEYEDKLKRMREIFGQASKNIDSYRATITEKETELEKLSLELEECQTSEQKYKIAATENQLTMEKLNTEITSQKASYGSDVKQLEAKTRQLTSQLEQTKNNYDQYKKRANLLLEKNKGQKSDSVRINELEELVQQLQSQKIKYEAEQSERESKQSLLEYDIKQALDRINQLESKQSLLIKDINSKEIIIEEMKQSSIREKRTLETINTLYQQTSDQLAQSKKSLEAQVEAAAVTVIEPNTTEELEMAYTRIKDLEQSNDALYQQVLSKEEEIKKLLVTTPVSPPDEQLVLNDEMESVQSDNSSYMLGKDVYASMSSLLSPLVTRPSDERLGQEKQIQRLSEMLHESEDKVTALRAQEKLLKEELRKLDAFDKRQNMNAEYLKNVLIKFLVSENKQTMVPIIAKLLCLDKTETDQLIASTST